MNWNCQESFLLYKQFYSIRAALSVLCGRTAGGKSEAFILEKLESDEKGTTLMGMISVEMVAVDMEDCEGCRCPLPKSDE